MADLEVGSVLDRSTLMIPDHLWHRLTGYDRLEDGLSTLRDIETVDWFDESWWLHLLVQVKSHFHG